MAEAFPGFRMGSGRDLLSLTNSWGEGEEEVAGRFLTKTKVAIESEGCRLFLSPTQFCGVTDMELCPFPHPAIQSHTWGFICRIDRPVRPGTTEPSSNI